MKMNNLELCRICTINVNEFATNLFEEKNLLEKIKEITGQWLRNKRFLPKHICAECEQNLKRAHSFRKRCIESQLYFNSTKHRQVLQRKTSHYFEYDSEEDKHQTNIIKEETSLTDANDLLEIYTEQESNNPLCEMAFSPVDDLTNVKKVISKVKLKKHSRQAMQRKLPCSKIKKNDEKTDLICDQCGNHFNCRHHFLTHLRRHSNDKPFKCEICPDKFYTHSELKRHMRRHTGERPFACQFCQRCFTDYSTRVKHERIHTNERPYSCSQCEKAFTTSYVLKNHMLVHTGERSFKCSLCNKSFQRQTHLTVHYRSLMHKQMLEKQNTHNMTIISQSIRLEGNDLEGI